MAPLKNDPVSRIVLHQVGGYRQWMVHSSILPIADRYTWSAGPSFNQRERERERESPNCGNYEDYAAPPSLCRKTDSAESTAESKRLQIALVIKFDLYWTAKSLRRFAWFLQILSNCFNVAVCVIKLSHLNCSRETVWTAFMVLLVLTCRVLWVSSSCYIV